MDDTLETLLAERTVLPVFQPIVDLRTGDVVACEALARGPAGPLHTPGQLFAAAARGGRVEELDRLCRARAIEDAAAAGLAAPLWLFLNLEPAGLGADEPSAASLAVARRHGLQVLVELTERALTDDPARLLAFADRARAAGLGLAVDDVGAVPESLALLPFLRPDVVKLDLGIVQRRPDSQVAEIMTAVTAYAEQSGAQVLAEGIETADHERAARSLGATLGQGWRFGRPAAFPPGSTAYPLPHDPLVIRRPPRAPAVTDATVSPFDAVSRVRSPMLGSKALLVAVSKLLERQAADMGAQAVVLATFEVAPNLTPASRHRYAHLASTAAFVVVLGAGMPAEPVPGVRGADLAHDDPVLGEWDVAVVGPHFAAALVARDRHDGRPDPERTFDYVLTYDRAVVLDVARSLMVRALPAMARATPPRPAPQPAATAVGVPT